MDINTMIFPLLGPIGTIVNTVRVLIGGVFGIYLIILYIRWREYKIMKKNFAYIRNALEIISAEQGIELKMCKKSKIESLGAKIRALFSSKNYEDSCCKKMPVKNTGSKNKKRRT